MKRIPDPQKMIRIRGPRPSRQELVRAKVRITTYVDRDILDTLRTMAQDSGSKYQALLNQVLRHSLFGKREGLVARIDRLEHAVFHRSS